LSDVEFRQLDKILLLAAESSRDHSRGGRKASGNRGPCAFSVVSAPICVDRRGEHCAKAIPPAEVDEILLRSRDLAERRRVWEASRQPGVALKRRSRNWRDLRNRVAAELGYSSYLHLQVADYGMTVPEMMQLMDRTTRDFAPLYRQLHASARRRLAARYRQPVPRRMPAHWLPERWGQRWPGGGRIGQPGEGLRGKSPEWMVRQAERFSTSIGFPALPATFWERSDLYPLARDAGRQKRSGSWTVHIDRDQDVRTLLSLGPGFRLFQVSHHELGHAHYDFAYAHPGVPYLLRDGANRAFHEAIAELIAAAARQEPYLRSLGVIAPGRPMDATERLLDEALDNGVVGIPWAAAAVNLFEYDLYEKKLPAEQWNRRWWELVARYQGIEPPAPRAEASCDICSKAQLIERPAQYYDYALALLIRYQLHDYNRAQDSAPGSAQLQLLRESAGRQMVVGHDERRRHAALAATAAGQNRGRSQLARDAGLLPAAHRVSGQGECRPAGGLGVRLRCWERLRFPAERSLPPACPSVPAARRCVALPRHPRG